MPKPDLSGYRRAVQLRNRCREAAVAAGQRLDLPISPVQANVAFDAMLDLIRDHDQPKPAPTAPSSDDIRALALAVIDARLNLADAIRKACPGPHSYVDHHDGNTWWCYFCGYTEQGSRVNRPQSTTSPPSEIRLCGWAGAEVDARNGRCEPGDPQRCSQPIHWDDQRAAWAHEDETIDHPVRFGRSVTAPYLAGGAS